MKKYILGFLSVLFLTVLVIPSFSFAQVGDVDPNPTASDCISLQSSGLRYRARDANTNGEVSLLQDFLQVKGYLNSEPTGYFGILTLKAVKDFQKDNNISPTGYVGPATKAKIKSASCGGEIVVDPDKDPITNEISILSATGPQTLNIGQNGKWTIKASDKTGGNLTYSVNWGDVTLTCPSGASCAMAYTPEQTGQTATFIHSYSKAGTYNPTFTVTNSSGKSTQTSLSVKVEETTTTPVVLSVSGPQTLNVNQTGTWTVNASDSSVGNLTYYVSWGDDGDTDASEAWRSSQQSATFTHYYLKAGTYGPKFFVTNSNGKTGSASVSVKVGVSSISVLSPKVGDIFSAGQTITIKWTPGAPGLTYINFYKNDSTYSTSARVQNNPDTSGSMQYTFPVNMPAGQYTINAFYETNLNGSVSSSDLFKSNGTFTIISTNTTTPTITSFYYLPQTTPGEVVYGETVTIHWASANATSCTASDGTYSGLKATSGSMPTASITSTKKYTLQCVNSSGVKSDIATLTLVPKKQPSVACLDTDGNNEYIKGTISGLGTDGIMKNQTDSVRPANFYGDGYSYVIEWICTDPTTTNGISYATNTNIKCEYGAGDGVCLQKTSTTAPHISDVSGPTSINANTAGTWKINAYSTTAVSYTVEWGDGQRQSFMPSSTFTHTYSTAGTYTASFSATNASGQSDSKNLSITVIGNTIPSLPVPVVSYFYSDKTTVDYGSTANMYWSSINATSCTASDGTYEGIKTASGNMLTGSLTKTTTFSLKCTGAGGTSGTSYVTINVLPQTTPVVPLPVISFFTSPDSVSYNGTATINWVVKNATSCTAGGDWSGPKSATSGSEVAGYYLTSSKNYTLTCIGAGGGASASAKITVGTQVIPVELPLTPASFRITSASTSSINFAWTDTSNNETGFKIYKNNSLLATLGPNVTTYSDLAGFQCNTTYSYNIVAYNSAGESRVSSSVTPGYTTCAVSEVVFGNVSGDGIVDCKDTTMIMQYLVGTTTFTDDQKNRADADRNGSVNSADVSYLLTKYNLSCSTANASSKPSLMASALDAFDDVKNTKEKQETNTIKNEVKTQELSCGEFNIILKNGKTDPQVKCLQRLLNRNGFKVEGIEEGKETNFFGKATEKAVKAFQAKNGLVVDGVFGPLSRAFLK
ncbi:MAG: peptidoglycan-binding protein [Burkholderiales bacterium]|nr:peptidoglycan-binding protein [Burkholderiales bacterium]